MNRAQLELAEWHAREAVLRGVAGEDDSEDYHREAACEALEAAIGTRVSRRFTVEEIGSLVQYTKDVAAVV